VEAAYPAEHARTGRNPTRSTRLDVLIKYRTDQAEPVAACATVKASAAAGPVKGFRPRQDEYAAALRRIEASPLP